MVVSYERQPAAFFESLVFEVERTEFFELERRISQLPRVGVIAFKIRGVEHFYIEGQVMYFEYIVHGGRITVLTAGFFPLEHWFTDQETT